MECIDQDATPTSRVFTPVASANDDVDDGNMNGNINK